MTARSKRFCATAIVIALAGWQMLAFADVAHPSGQTGSKASAEGFFQTLSLQIGGGVPISTIHGNTTDATAGGLGPVVGGQYLYSVNPRIQVGVDLSYSHYSSKTAADFPFPASTSNLHSDSLLWALVLRRMFGDGNLTRPYIFGGLGASQTHLVVDTGSPATSIDDTETPWAVIFGGGLNFRIQPRLSIETEIRLRRFADTTYGGGSKFDGSSVSGSSADVNFLTRAAWSF